MNTIRKNSPKPRGRPPKNPGENGSTRGKTGEEAPLLHEIVQEKIKDYILRHHLKPGDPLPNERELVVLMGVSRTSVREAVKSLAALGVLEVRHGSGLYVQNFDMDRLLDTFAYDLMFSVREMADLFEIRFHMEYGMAARAIRAVTEDQLKELNAILKRMRVDAEKGKYSSETDRDFHKALWMNIDNKALNKFLDVSFLVRHLTFKTIYAGDPVDPMFSHRRHLKIVEALRDRDLQAMKTALICHYTLVDAVSGINADSMEPDFIRHSIELELRLHLANKKISQ